LIARKVRVVCAWLLGVLFAALLVTGIALGNGVIVALSLVAAMISIAFVYALIWTARRQSQINGVTTGDSRASENERLRPTVLVTPRAAGGAALLARHPLAALGVLVCGVGGPLLVAYSIIAFSPSSAVGTFVLFIGCFAFVGAIGGGVLMQSGLLMQDDIARLTRSRTQSFAWGYSTSAGLRAWIAKSRPADPSFKLRKAGYVLYFADKIEFWQRGPSALEQIVVVPRELIRAVRVGEGSYGYQSLKAVFLSVEDDAGSVDSVPLLVRGKVTSWQAYFHAPEQFVDAWRSV